MEQTTTQPTNSPKYAFLYLLSLFTLLFMAISVGMVIFQIINLTVEVIFTGVPGFFSISWLIVPVFFTPIFFLIFKKWWLLWFDRLDVER